MQNYKVLSVTTGKEVTQSYIGKAPKEEVFKVVLTEKGKKWNEERRKN